MASGGTVLVLVVFISSGIQSDESASANNDYPTIMVERIRRQLMKENYDYMSKDTDEDFPNNEITTPRPRVAEITRKNELESDFNDNFMPRAKDLETKDEIDDSHPVDKDQLYYVENDRLKQTSEALEEIHKDVVNNTGETIVESSVKPKYKVFKVKQPFANRRSGKTYRSFIQEETENGVAIINLNDEPFPEFRLPRTRRQYMDNDGVDSELEIAALSETDLSTDLEGVQDRILHKT